MSDDASSLGFHKKAHGKVEVQLTCPITTREDLSLTYTPGVAAAANAIARNQEDVWEYTGRKNRVAIVTDGSAVLGLGDIGPEAALPVMEGKAALFKAFAGIDAFPLCLGTKNVEEIVQTVTALEPSFGGINLEDISAPRCFAIEEMLKEQMSIPVFHDDQHGTAIVVLAGLLNAMEVLGKSLEAMRITISGAGAAGTAIARILLSQGARNILIVDRHGIIHRNRSDLNSAAKTFLAAATNPENREGTLKDALQGSNIFVGVSAPNLVSADMIRSMADDAVVFALANPHPEILPEDASKAGAAIVASGRSDFPNQVNNILAFPGVFRGALDAGAKAITEEMKLAAAKALAACVGNPTAENILPDPLEKGVAEKVAEAVKRAA